MDKGRAKGENRMDGTWEGEELGRRAATGRREENGGEG